MRVKITFKSGEVFDALFPEDMSIEDFVYFAEMFGGKIRRIKFP